MRKDDLFRDHDTWSADLRRSGIVTRLQQLLNRYIVAAVLIQFVGYAALSALIPHGDYSLLVEPLQRLPVLLLVPLALFAIPALVIALILGGILSVASVQPVNVLVLVSIYLVAIACVWGYRKLTSNEEV